MSPCTSWPGSRRELVPYCVLQDSSSAPSRSPMSCLLLRHPSLSIHTGVKFLIFVFIQQLDYSIICIYRELITAWDWFGTEHQMRTISAAFQHSYLPKTLIFILTAKNTVSKESQEGFFKTTKLGPRELSWCVHSLLHKIEDQSSALPDSCKRQAYAGASL